MWKPKILYPISIILLAVLIRLLPHPPNMAPITAMALFGGIYLDKKYALVIPLVALFLSDFVLGFHDTMLFVYGSFLLSGIIGLLIRKHKSFGIILIGSLVASFSFFLITNFGVWLVGNMYPHTVSGLVDCYLLALPFFRNTLSGDLFYVVVLVGGFNLMQVLYRIHEREEGAV
jgi:hypothetical protein